MRAAIAADSTGLWHGVWTGGSSAWELLYNSGGGRQLGFTPTHSDGLNMNFSLTDEQRAWQMKAREFAQDEIRPLSIKRDQIEGGRETWDWDIIRKGSKLGFRTQAVPRDWGGEGTDFVTQGLVMAELARGDSAISKAFSQNWKLSHLIA